MVDVLSARMQAVYTNWDQRPKSPPIRKASTNSFRRLGYADRRDKSSRAQHSDILQQQRERELFRSKDSPWIQGFPTRPIRPFMGLACKACTPDSKDYSYDLTVKNAEVKNILRTETEKSGSLLTRVFCHIVHIWRFQKFDFPQVFDKVLVDSRLRDAIEETTNELVENAVAGEKSSKDVDTDELYNKILVSQELRARNILLDMRSTLSDVLLRVTTWLLYKLFPRFLTSVCLHPSHLAMLQKAAKTNLPLIFVPLHRSHLDYILITFILQNISVKSPLVAAGNNLRIPVFGWLLRGLGAFFIKRRIDPVIGRKDILYRAVLQTYMVECLRAGHNIEFYIEGGRTRTGKPCMPKGGLLSVIIGAYMDGTIEDALLVPVSVNYDKLVDGNFISELLGQPKQMETFSSAMTAIWTTLRSNYGCIRIDFNQPFSLKELVKSFQNLSRPGRLSQTDFFSSNDTDSSPVKKNGLQKEKSFRSVPSTTSLYGTDVVDESHRTLVDKIARHLIYDCSKACAVMSTNSLAFLLLNKYREGVPLDKLVIAFDQLRQQLMSDNRDVGFSGESIDVIEHAIKLLGPSLVKREMKKSENSTEIVDFITPVTTLPNVIGLSYYSNTLVTHFMVEGVVATAISACVKTESGTNLTASLDDIMKNAVELCEILQFEFIFTKPCEPLEFVITEAVDKFKFMEIITTEEIVNMGFEEWARSIPRLPDDSEDDDFSQFKPSPVFVVNGTAAEVEKFELFHSILRPLIDSYVAAAMCLHKMVGKQLTEYEFTQQVLEEIKNQLLKGYISFGESSSVDAIKNALKLFKKWNIIEMYNRDSVILVYLTDSYNSEEALEPIVKRIGHFKFLTEENANSERRAWEKILKHERIENLGVSHWRAHEPLISTLPVEFIRKINVTDDELITYLGTLELKKRQLFTLAEVVKASRGAAVLNKEQEVLKLGNIICGYSANDLAQISASVLRFLLRNNFFQNLKGCSIGHLRLLAKEAQSYTVIGPARTWEPEVVELAGHLLAGLDEGELRKIRIRCVARISPAVIDTIPSNVLKKMRNEQLLTLTKPSLLAWRRNTKDLRAIYSGTALPVSLKISILMLISICANEGMPNLI